MTFNLKNSFQDLYLRNKPGRKYCSKLLIYNFEPKESPTYVLHLSVKPFIGYFPGPGECLSIKGNLFALLILDPMLFISVKAGIL